MVQKALASMAFLICLSGFYVRADERLAGVSCDDRADCGDVCTCGPRWTVGAARFSWTARVPTTRCSSATPAPGAALLNADEFDFDWEMGLDISAMYHRRPNAAVDFRYMWLGDHSDTVAYTLPAPTNVIVHTEPTTFFAGNTAGTATFASQLHSFELNDRRTNGCRTLLYGFRYVNIADESLSALLDYPGSGEAARWDADNNLYGLQIGAERSLSAGNMLLSAGGKAGVYYADMETSFDLDRNYDGTIDAFAEANDADVAFLGELAFAASYSLTDRLSLRAGYQLLWLEGVAVGTEQVAATEPFNAVGRIGTRVDCGGIFYHGASTGLQYTY